MSHDDRSSEPPVFTDAQAIDWDDLTDTSGRNWSETASSAGVALVRFAEGVRLKRVFFSPDFRFGYIMMAPGMVYPAHRHPAPEIYHLLGGTARWTVDDRIEVVGAGTTIYMRPMASHRVEVVSDEPMRAIWAQWAPDGDASCMDTGYQLLEMLPDLPDRARFADDETFCFPES